MQQEYTTSEGVSSGSKWRNSQRNDEAGFSIETATCNSLANHSAKYNVLHAIKLAERVAAISR